MNEGPLLMPEKRGPKYGTHEPQSVIPRGNDPLSTYLLVHVPCDFSKEGPSGFLRKAVPNGRQNRYLRFFSGFVFRSFLASGFQTIA